MSIRQRHGLALREQTVYVPAEKQQACVKHPTTIREINSQSMKRYG